MNKISFEFIPEHEVVIGKEEEEALYATITDQIEILIDGKNVFADDGFGMFPSDFFSQDKHFYEGELQVGICGCTCYQCHDTYVNVNSTNDMVVWTTKVWSKKDRSYISGNKYFFEKKEYKEKINVLSKKYVSTEIYTKINEIIKNVLYNKETNEGYVYNMFCIYEYGDTIILYFIKENMEKKYYIGYKNNYNILIENLNKFKEENIK
jgi:hypothetical protein